MSGRARSSLVIVVALLFLPVAARAAGAKGTFVQSDNLGMNLVTYRFDNGTTSTVADSQALSEFVGLHYYVLDGLRIGLNFQFSELLSPPGEGASRFTNFSLLPQIGWDFYGPMFAALIGTISPRAYGKNETELGFQGLLGASMALAGRVRGSLAVEVPVNLRLRESLGLTLIAGVSWRL